MIRRLTDLTISLGHVALALQLLVGVLHPVVVKRLPLVLMQLIKCVEHLTLASRIAKAAR